MIYELTGNVDDEAFYKLIENLKSTNKITLCDKAYSIGVSICLILFYTIRYLQLKRKFSIVILKDLKNFTFWISVLCAWNIVLSLYSDMILYNINRVASFLKDNYDPENILALFLNFDKDSALNKFYYKKDLRILAVGITSIALYKKFSRSILTLIEFISFFSGYEVDEEAKLDTHDSNEGSKKKVSFDEKLITYEYSDSFESVSKSKLSNAPLFLRFKLKSIFLFIFTLVLWTIVLPDYFIFSTTSVLIDFPFMKIKTDHIVVSLVSLFLLDTIFGFAAIAKHPAIKSFPFAISVIARLIYIYNSIVMNISITCMYLIVDILANWLEMSLSNDHIHSSAPVQIFTLIFINYFDFSSEKCSDVSKCDVTQSFSIMLRNFHSLYHILLNCWSVLNMFYLSILPLFIWVLLVEFKLNGMRYDLSNRVI